MSSDDDFPLWSNIRPGEAISRRTLLLIGVIVLVMLVGVVGVSIGLSIHRAAASNVPATPPYSQPQRCLVTVEGGWRDAMGGLHFTRYVDC